MDLIDRQAAIDAFDGVKVDEKICDEYDIGYNDGIDFAVAKWLIEITVDMNWYCADGERRTDEQTVSD